MLSEYSSFTFGSPKYWTRGGRALNPLHRLYVDSFSHQSPIELTTIIPEAAAALGLAWVFVQVVAKMYNLPLEHRKLELEVQKLEQEAKANEKDIQGIPKIDVNMQMENRGSDEIIRVLTTRVSKQPIRVKDVSFEYFYKPSIQYEFEPIDGRG